MGTVSAISPWPLPRKTATNTVSSTHVPSANIATIGNDFVVKDENNDNVEACLQQVHSQVTFEISGNAHVAIGTNIGCIALVRGNGGVSVLQCGNTSAVQHLLIARDTTAPTSATNADSGAGDAMPDIVVGDSGGQVTIFTLGSVFSRNTLPAPISALTVDSNPNTPSNFLVGDMSGAVTSFHAQEVLWRAQIGYSMEAIPTSGNANGTDMLDSMITGALDTKVNGICSVRWPDNYGIATNYVLAAAGSGIQVLCQGMLVLSVPVLAPCNALRAGTFFGLPGENTQAILGDEAGYLYVLDNFKLTPYAQVDYPITHIASLPLREFFETDGPDIVICTTRSNTIYVLCGGHIVGKYEARAWPLAVGVIEMVYESRRCPALVVAENSKQAIGDGVECVLRIVVLECELTKEAVA
ncbi:hypothetical protein GGI25_001505 [Coemansia spiralis]|uniref:Uncharacterized protein n=2 Tax=Coemansia TaxID=4863 RepID=A0A9W8G5U3_9FUNG|nr:hypothetical protein GGI25_001505 [Coemansia spiralis]